MAEETMPRDMGFGKPKQEIEKPVKYKKVKIIISVSDDGSDTRLVKVIDPNGPMASAKQLRLPRNEAVEVDERVLNQLGSKGPFKEVQYKWEGIVDGRPVKETRTKKLYRYPYHIV